MMMDIASWLREVRMSTNTSDWNAAFVNNRLDEAANEIERLRRDVEEANARAYIMAKEITLWQSRAALKEGE